MEKESGLWDDSEILKAFDNAVKKYKEMNKQNHHNNSIMRRTMETNLEKLTRSTDEEDEVTGSVKVDDDNIVVLSIVKDAAEATDLPSYQENCPADSSAPDPLMHASSSHIPEVIEGYTNTKGEVEYNQLLSQYYELQGQMQKVVQQLYQVGNEPCQFTCEGSGSGAQWGTRGSTQDHQDPITSHPVAVSSCFPCACYCSGYSYPSLPAFALCGASVGNTDAYHAATACTGGPAKLSSFNDDPAAKTAAERAIASVKQITSGTTNVHEGDEHLDSSRDKIAQSVGSGTELDVVLSAWYTAGFHTGRYLMEQSNTKKGQTNVHATGIHDQKSTSL